MKNIDVNQKKIPGIFLAPFPSFGRR